MPSEKYKSLLRENYLSLNLPAESVDINNASCEKTPLRTMSIGNLLSVRNTAEVWNKKNFPDTLAKNIKIFDEYLSLCEENNSRPIIFTCPMANGYENFFDKKKKDEFYYIIREAQKKHSAAVFVDGWKMQGFSNADFYDAEHLNIKGAAKFSAMLNNFIESLEMR